MSDNQIQQLQQSVHWNERTLRRAKDLLAEIERHQEQTAQLIHANGTSTTRDWFKAE